MRNRRRRDFWDFWDADSEFMTVAGGFLPGGATFDGTNDGAFRASQPTGAVDGSRFLASLWFKKRGGDGTLTQLVGTGATWRILSSTDNTVEARLQAPGGTPQVFRNTSTTFTANPNAWHHFLCWGDTNAAAGAKTLEIMINGAADQGAITDAGAAFDIDYTIGNVGLGERVSTGPVHDRLWNGDLAEVAIYFNPPADFLASGAANILSKFRTTAGRAVDLGTDGSRPFGTAATFYHSIRPGDAASALATNRGTGGAVTAVGSYDLVAGPNG